MVSYSGYVLNPAVTVDPPMTVAAWVADARGVFWDRAAWAWRAQDGQGHSSTHPTWSEAKAALDAMAGPFASEVTVTWSPVGYAPEGTTVDLSDTFRTVRGGSRIDDRRWVVYGEPKTKAPRKARKKGKRK